MVPSVVSPRLSGFSGSAGAACIEAVAEGRTSDTNRPTTDREWSETALTIVLLLITLFLLKPSASAQDPQFSQFYASPLYLNPALTGNTYQDRIILNYRRQWLGIAPGYETYCVSYDHNDSKLHSGFGGMVLRDVAGSNGLAFTHAAFNYSFEARIDHKRAVRFGTRLGYTLRQFDQGSLVFADQIIREDPSASIEAGFRNSTSYFDGSTGVMYFSEAFWFGVSFNHLNRPQQTLFTDGNVRLPVRSSFHTGYRFAMDGQKLRRSKTYMTVAAHYKMQDKWDQLDIGTYLDHDRLNFGLWYRGLPAVKSYQPGYPNDESIIAMVGYETPQQIRITYSYDITISLLSMRSGGAHEISVIYEWPKRGKNKKWRAVPCPKF